MIDSPLAITSNHTTTISIYDTILISRAAAASAAAASSLLLLCLGS